jgi:hypothetical protein
MWGRRAIVRAMSRSRSLPALAARLAAALAALAACDGTERPQDPSPPAETAPIPSAAAVPPAETAPTDAGADGGPSLADVAGTWEGAYEAKKGRVGMPSGVADPGRDADDGKAVSGPGNLKITVKPGGDVTGKSWGALGNAAIRGKIEGKMLRASFLPDDMAVPKAMTGVLVGIVKGDTIQAELRVAGPDALLVRQANFDLVKKQP